MKFTLSMKLCCLIVGACLSGPAIGGEDDRIEIRTIGIPPYGIQNEHNPGGIYYDIANLIAANAGFQSNNYLYPYARIVSELKSGQTDMTIMFKYKELEGHVAYIAPLPALKTVVVGLEGSDIRSIQDLKGKTLAYLRGARFSDAIDSDAAINKQYTRDFLQGAQMLVFGRVDAIVGPLDPILSAIAQIEQGQFALGEPLVVSERTPWLQVANTSVDRLDPLRLRAMLLDIVESGKFEAIRDKYTQH